MEKIVLVYTRYVEGLVASAIQKHKNNPIEGVELIQFNGEKQKFKNFFKKYEVDKIYLHSKYHKKIIEELKEIQPKDVELIEYNSDLMYKAERVPGNKFKTIEYYLYEMIKYSGKEDKKAFIINKSTIEEVQIDLFVKKFPHLGITRYYDTFEEAKEELIDRLEYKLNMEYKSIERYKKAIEEYEKLKIESQEKIDKLLEERSVLYEL